MRTLTSAGLFALLLASAGCFTSDTTVKLNPDGSGTVIQKTLINSQMLIQLQTMMTGMAQQMGAKNTGQASVKMPDMFSDAEAKAKTAKMGEGVSFVSCRKLKTEQAEGIEAVYAFSDITKLRISDKPDAPAMQGLPMPSTGPATQTAFRFQKLPNGHSVLTIVMPPSKPEKNSEPSGSPSVPSAPAKDIPPEQLEMAKKMFDGLRFSVVVDVQGSLVETNSAYVEGSRVTLIEMDFGQLLDNTALLTQMAGVKPGSFEDAKNLLKNVKGFKINLDPELKIEFK